jgi:spore coat polysaccharide biosynthesis predicted glycosyltransferase SpsG
MEDASLDTVLSVVDDRHLCWSLADGKPKAVYTARVNRQQLPPNFRETGAIIGCRSAQLEKGTRIGGNVALLEMPQERSFDIDSISDLYLCESILNRKRVVFAVVGYPSVGLGHAYRASLLAHEMVQCDIYFVCEEKSALAAEYIARHNYRVLVCPDGELLKTIRETSPDMVINDILDTDASYIHDLKELGCKVINFEDMGSGYKEADLVINALYPHQLPCDHVLVGPEFFCLRDEFLYISRNRIADDVLRIMVTFGGVDEGNLTARVTALIAPWCLEQGIALDIALGPGFAHNEELDSVVEQYPDSLIRIINNTTRISEFMCQADMAITSGGRTVLELASLEMPTIVICQNRRETTHTFASSENGIVNLGFHGEVTDEDILETTKSVALDRDLRRTMRKKLKKLDLTKGKQRVVQRIMGLFN